MNPQSFFTVSARLRRMLPLLGLGLALGASTQAETFTLFIYESPAAFAARTDPEKGPAYWGSFADAGKTLQTAGILRGGAALHGHDHVKKVHQGQAAKTTSGAYAQAKLQLGGYFIIDVPTAEDAAKWAAKLPFTGEGVVEVRPHYPVPGMNAPATP